jgi:2-polyprenyl-3-methyl-5-hydroxy-6-metoxy-1,4-benzoquinol methylase
MWHGEFRHPRLVDVYDAQFAWSREDDSFLEFVNETPAARVADVGCGTGRLTVALAAAGHQVMGGDPARGITRRGSGEAGRRACEVDRGHIQRAR